MDENENILLFKENLYAWRSLASKNTKWKFNEPLHIFLNAMSILSSQMSSPRIEAYIINHLGLNKSKNLDKGDMIDNNGNYHEFKFSAITSTNKNLNLRQLRDWQGTDYIFCVSNLLEKNPTCQFFFLSKQDMTKENEIIAGSATHGTTTANSNNKNIENSKTININSDHYKRWVNLYGISLNDLKIKLNGNIE